MTQLLFNLIYMRYFSDLARSEQRAGFYLLPTTTFLCTGEIKFATFNPIYCVCVFEEVEVLQFLLKCFYALLLLQIKWNFRNLFLHSLLIDRHQYIAIINWVENCAVKHHFWQFTVFFQEISFHR